MLNRLAVSLTLFACGPYLLASRTPTSEDARDAMMLFTYWPKDGQEQAFHEGYRTHLEWHRENHDSIVWYAWDVIAGRRTGLFVDGAFDVSFRDLDRRSKPAEDALNFQETAAAFASVNDRVVFRLRRDLGTDHALEERRASRLVEALWFRVVPGRQSDLESILTAVKERSGDRYSVYEIVAAGQIPGYLILRHRSSLTEIGASTDAFWDTIEQSGDNGPGALMEAVRESVEQIESEIWRYREDLTYFPAE